MTYLQCGTLGFGELAAGQMMGLGGHTLPTPENSLQK